LHFAEELTESADLVAVGGYGRGELHPQSDIDLLCCSRARPSATRTRRSAASHVPLDIGLEPGHSVRTLEDCEAQARSDVTVLTTLMETRLLHGPGRLFAQLPVRIGTDRMWNSAEFFRAKVDEQTARHSRYHDTAYNLEPNVKGSPGGLRDIQMISWLARRHLGVTRSRTRPSTSS
jgi:[protein-PII] uridylyltransferase